MTAILRLESRKLLRGSLLLAGIFAIIVVFMLAVFPSMAEEAEAIEAAFPEHVLGFFGMEEMHTVEGFISSYLFPFVWVLILGVYFGYLGGGMVAGEIRDRRMDLTLSNPVSRESVVIQKVAALWVPIFILIGVVYGILLGGVQVLGESVDPVYLALAHLFIVPYLLVCATIGVMISIVVDRQSTGQTGALGVVFLLWLIDGLSEMDPDLEWIGAFTPSRYVDSPAVLIHEEIVISDVLILTVAFVVLLTIAIGLFVRRDI